jgi:hypothetical protein
VIDSEQNRRSHGEPLWALNLYPPAAEAGGCLVVPDARVPRGDRSDPDRAEAEAVRRARAKLRRDVGSFFKDLRPALGGESFPYLWVPEPHPGGHGLHVHFAVGRYVRWTLIRDSWGLGRVHIQLIGDLPVGSGRLGEARYVGRYLGKYVSKSLDDGGRTLGLDRYEVAQGFRPEQITVYGRSDDDAIARASDYLGREPVQKEELSPTFRLTPDDNATRIRALTRHRQTVRRRLHLCQQTTLTRRLGDPAQASASFSRGAGRAGCSTIGLERTRECGARRRRHRRGRVDRSEADVRDRRLDAVVAVVAPPRARPRSAIVRGMSTHCALFSMMALASGPVGVL